MKLIIVNDGLSNNLGDQAILKAMTSGIEKILPAAELQVFPNSNMLTLRQYHQFWKALIKSDLLIFGGGQEIQDQASVAFLISGLLKIFLAKLAKKHVYCYALGAGPVKRVLSKLLIRLILNKVDLITVRDKTSRSLLQRLGVRKVPIHHTADPAFTLTPEDDSVAENIFKSEVIPLDDNPRIVISLRRWFHYDHFLLPMRFRTKLLSKDNFVKFEQLKQILVEFIEHLITLYSARIILLPMRHSGRKADPGQDDEIVAQEIYELTAEKKNVIIIKGNYSPSEIKAFLGKTDLVFGMRMHSLILASMMGVPVMGLNLSTKFHSFFDMIDQQNYLIEPDNITSENLINTFSTAWGNRENIKQQLITRKKILQRMADSNLEFLVKLMENLL